MDTNQINIIAFRSKNQPTLNKRSKKNQAEAMLSRLKTFRDVLTAEALDAGVHSDDVRATTSDELKGFLVGLMSQMAVQNGYTRATNESSVLDQLVVLVMEKEPKINEKG